MVVRTLLHRFTEQVALTPSADAICAATGSLTYAELDIESDRLAQRLRELGAGPENAVAVLVERSPELVIATLAVVKTGGYYVPLHAGYPLERLQAVVDQVGSPLLLTDDPSSTAARLTGTRATVDVAEGPTACPVGREAADPHPEHLAYVLFTSGSTGAPKGVAVTHRDALALARDGQWEGGAHERVVMASPYAFGMSTYELWVPLCRGGAIILPPAGDLDVPALERTVVEHRATVVHLTAGLFGLVAEDAPSILAPLREVMTGGDVISSSAVAKVLEACPRLVVRTLYGATETTLFTTTRSITAPYEPGASVPTGFAMDGMRLHLLDDDLRPVGPGATGELYVAGEGVARGYVGRPDLTAERFVPDPFAGDGTRMYRTGDLARLTDGGLLDLLGRADDQIKVRGFRVELGEVEAALSRHPDVAHAAVVPRDVGLGDKRLTAYVVARTPGLDVAAMRRQVAATLPDYMVPDAVAVLDRLPLTTNGKLDRAALPAPGEETSTGPATTSDTVAVICRVFASVLGRDTVDPDDDFFEVSGQSMQAIRLTLRIAEEIGDRITVPQLYDNPSPAQLAALIDASAGVGS